MKVKELLIKLQEFPEIMEFEVMLPSPLAYFDEEIEVLQGINVNKIEKTVTLFSE